MAYLAEGIQVSTNGVFTRAEPGAYWKRHRDEEEAKVVFLILVRRAMQTPKD